LHGRPFVLVRAPASRQRHRPTNSSLDGDALIYKQYFHIGFAADTPNGWWCR
jgi:pyruvate dehydrogenase E2 component (dihydrolipoamide acetyltransferase)